MFQTESRPDIARALQRSRDARSAIRSRRRRLAIVGLILATALAGGGVWSLEGLTGNDVVQAAVSHAKSLVDLLDQRSPGARTEGTLTKTKTKHARPLAKERRAPIAAHLPSILPPNPNAVQLVQLVTAPPSKPLPDIAFSPPPSLGAIIAPPPGAPVIPPGGGGPVTPPLVQPPQEVLPPSPLPEPGTWAMMLIGFGLIGWQARRKAAAAATARA